MTTLHLLSRSLCVVMAYAQGVPFSTGWVFKGRASNALEEGVIPLLHTVHSVSYPVPQHEEEVRQPKRSAGGETVQSDIALGQGWVIRYVDLQ